MYSNGCWLCHTPPAQDIAIVTGAEFVAKDLGMKVRQGFKAEGRTGREGA